MSGRGSRAQEPPDDDADREPPPPGEEPEAGDQAPADPDKPTDDVRKGNILVEPTPGD
jgi:hypothetical protein